MPIGGGTQLSEDRVVRDLGPTKGLILPPHRVGHLAPYMGTLGGLCFNKGSRIQASKLTLRQSSCS